MRTFETDVIVIGGGATGCGILRDCALRGIPAVLIEKDDIASGTTGRNHGLLHSGARYAVKDRESAEECIAENNILKKIARHCIEDTGGLFVSLPEDDPEYFHALVKGCKEAGIDARAVSVKKALALEPNLNPKIVRALHVPDGTIDPFRLAAANMLDAVEHGAQVFTHTEVTGMIRRQDIMRGVQCRDRQRNESFEIHGRLIVNAAGVWGQRIAEMCGIELTMHPSKGSMVIIDYRVNNIVVNRCRVPADGDIVVPGDTVSLIGTTSRKIPYSGIDELYVDDDEIDVLLKDGEKLIPNISQARVLRAYCGVRPLVSAGSGANGREISRGIVLIDHAERDGLTGLITIAGGKLMTYRLMAQMAVDLACRKLGIVRDCRTHEQPLPGSDEPPDAKEDRKRYADLSESIVGSAYFRHGDRINRILRQQPKSRGLICECEMVTSGELTYAIQNLKVKDLVDLRRRTRLGMGPCQGGLCVCRAAEVMALSGKSSATDATKMLIDFLEERWKGVKPVLWGDALRESEFTYWIYQGLFGIGNTIEGFKGRGEGVVLKEEY